MHILIRLSRACREQSEGHFDGAVGLRMVCYHLATQVALAPLSEMDSHIHSHDCAANSAAYGNDTDVLRDVDE